MESPITMNYIDSLTGLQFEQFTGELLTKLGYRNVYVTRASDDNGIDVLAINNKGQRIGFQCKHSGCNEFINKYAVDETLEGSHYYNLDKAIIISNSYFCKTTLYKCKKHHILFWDRNNLIRIINGINYSSKLLNFYEASNMDDVSIEPYTLDQKRFILSVNSLIKSSHLRNYVNSLDEIDFENFMIKLFKIHKFGKSINKFKNLDKYSCSLGDLNLINLFKSDSKYKYKYKLGICFIHVEHNSGKIPTHVIKNMNISLNVNNLNQGCLITNGHFTNKDSSIADKYNIALVDQDKLCNMIKNLVSNINFNIISNKFINLRTKLSLTSKELEESCSKQSKKFRINRDDGFLDPNNLLDYLI